MLQAGISLIMLRALLLQRIGVRKNDTSNSFRYDSADMKNKRNILALAQNMEFRSSCRSQPIDYI